MPETTPEPTRTLLRLVLPSPAYRESFLASHAEWAGQWQDGAGLEADTDLSSPDAFEAWVEELLRQEDAPLRPEFVSCTYRWMVVGGEYVGSIALRHELNDFLENYGGQLGYGVRPSARRRGYASAALGQMLQEARGRGMERVLLVCAEDNLGSRRTIEAHGGVLEDVRDHDGAPHRRYWVSLGTRSVADQSLASH